MSVGMGEGKQVLAEEQRGIDAWVPDEGVGSKQSETLGLNGGWSPETRHQEKPQE